MIVALPLIPFAAAIMILLIPGREERMLKLTAMLACGLNFMIVIWMLMGFEIGLPGYQFVYAWEWIPSLGIQYKVGVDGINMTLCLLHALVSTAGVFMACNTKERLKEYLFFYLILVGAIYGVFTALDLFFLYLFYETTLIPLYPMIGIWGSKNKEYGAMKLTIFITTGAVVGLFGLLLLVREAGINSFDLVQLQEAFRAGAFSGDFQRFLAPFIVLGFGVMASLWPLHSWSPIGYAAAPTSVSMLHAGVLKKMGPYFILRVAVTLLPAGIHHWAPVLAVLACIGIIYAGMAAIWQKDLKFIIGFSSVSHMGYVLLAIAACNATTLAGAVLLMFSHGVMAACTFALIGFIYEQTHARGISDYGGLAKQIPFISMCFVMACMASLGLPGFSNFVSELLVLIGSWSQFPVIVCIAVVGILITAIYLLRTVHKVCYGEVNPQWPNLKDALTLYERFPFMLLLGALLLFGFWPQGLLQIIRPAVGGLLP